MAGCPDRPGGPPPTRVSNPLPHPALPRDAARLPALAPDYGVALERGLAALGLTLTAEARLAIETHARLLLAWNASVNLTAVTQPAAIAIRHVVDSLTAVPMLAEAREILDLGSGGGYPGVPLAATLPESRVTLLDSVAKKADFLETVVSAAGLGDRVTVRVGRAEALAASAVRWDVVVARGVGSLADLVELAMPLLSLGGRLVAWKRGDLAAELAAGLRAAAALAADGPSVRRAIPGPPIAGLEGHVLVEVRKSRPTPGGWPRPPGVRRRRPW